jgi:hypothetical protein
LSYPRFKMSSMNELSESSARSELSASELSAGSKLSASELSASELSFLPELTTVGFARLVWRVGEVARANGLVVPGFRDVPAGVARHLRRRPGQQPVVVLSVKGRPEADVLGDVVDGVLAVNPAIDLAVAHAFAAELGLNRSVTSSAA